MSRIQALGRDLQYWLRVAHDESMAGEAIEPLRPEVEELERRFERVERDLALAEPDETVESKARMVEMLLWNLRHALELGDARGALPQEAPRGHASEIGPTLLDAGPPANDDCGDAIPITFGTVTGSTSTATNDGAASCGASLYSPDVWLRFVAPADGTAFFTTSSSSYDTVLSAYSSCPGVLTSELECNDDTFALQPEIGLVVNEGEDYLIRVSGFDGAAGDFVLTVLNGAQITGRVTDSSTGGPVSGSDYVSLYDDLGYSRGAHTTDASGYYGFGGLRTGRYYLMARVVCSSECSHLAELYDDVPCPGGLPYGCSALDGTLVSASVGTTTSGIDFALDPASAISGQVRDLGNGEPVSSASVRLYDAVGMQVGSQYTDADGRYVVDELRSGTYYLAAQHSWYLDELYDGVACEGLHLHGCELTSGTPVVVPLASTVVDIDIDLQSLGGISGTVTDAATGLPISDAHMYVKQPDGTSVGQGQTDSEGAFSVGGLADGSYVVVASKYGYFSQLYDGVPCGSECDYREGTVVVTTGETETTGIDFELTLRPRISGSLTRGGTGAPLVNVPVRIYDSSRRSSTTAYTDTAGGYETSPLDADTYFVLSDSSDCMDELYDDIPCEYGCDVATGTPVITHAGGPTTGIDLVLDCLRTISGTVRAADGGTPLADMRVELWQSGHLKQYDLTDSSGAYWFSRVEPGTYFIATNEDGPYVDELYNDLECFRGPTGGCDPTLGTPVTIGVDADVTGIDMVLDRGGTISGTVVDDVSGLPVSDIEVKIYDETGELVESAATTTSGSFQLDGLVTGTYYAVAGTNSIYLGALYDDLPCPEGCDPTAGTPIPVSNGMATTGVDFSLARKGAIWGHVRANTDGRPLAGITMRLYDAEGSFEGYVDSDSGGAYSFDHVLPGTHFLVARSAEVVDELYDNKPCEESCDVTTGTPIQVTDATDPAVVDFALDLKGEIRGSVVAGVSGLPLSGVSVRLYDEAGAFVDSASSGGDGLFRITGLDGGTYYAWAYSYTITPQLYEGIPCPWASCHMTGGTPVRVDLNESATGIDFEVLDRGSIEGTVRDAITGREMPGARIGVWTADGDEVSFSSPDPWYPESDELGHYVLPSLPAGTYFVRTEYVDGYLDELYDDIQCPGSCTITKGQPVEVAPGATTPGIDFDLEYVEAAISGVVTDGGTGEPVGGVRLDVWNAATSSLVTSVLSSPNGAYLAALPTSSGEYRVSTDNHSGYLDEIYNDVPCPLGSALESLCDPAAGDLVTVSDNTITVGVSFSLVTSETVALFGDGFESGGETAWSGSAGAGWQVAEPAAHTGDYGLMVEVGGSTCVADDTVDLGPQIVSGLLTVDACASISTGDGFVVADGGEARLTAGMEIVLRNGASVEPGGHLTAAIDPGMSPYTFVRDDTPAAETSYQAELFINLDGLDRSGGVLDLFEVLSEDRKVLLEVDVVDRLLTLKAWDASGSIHTTSMISTRRGWNRLVVGWHAADAAQPWFAVNEGAPIHVDPIDTSTLRVAAVRLGVLPGTTGSVSGTIALDDFSSWR